MSSDASAPLASDVFEIRDASAETLQTLCALLERSTEREHFVYREAELDDLWRYLDTAIAGLRRETAAETPELRRLIALRAIVNDAHDAVGRDEDAQRAARRLRSALTPPAG